ncbi:ATP-binding cassette domain-containing protein [Brachyspira hyodysenteriae]|uniref:Molybdenum ABC transporter permease n=2 Tax=Brachyspira hyodysenteriae TaxID=159 RepID=A0A3B6VSM8_BRAHO|nr:ATP-binding cassette domain-containing protein [Brachyspira hyodysenteriae]ANN62358.1 molybdenum ABC transporter permease [Brachyspira hyodysenteriae ATCC 27164]KLI24017.1 molybdenum ABC transporter permease [Brachyspira hyodysenteriae]MCZ9840135.1 ATP-binding cassette domain-containing protein [Brachyspira hyodysenteriae]MCZ9848535.1 ATP-binding cassette domain-containing protein [Brachyspira hyodysenteriae]MCZ9871886.1 ATP-binding cassette domain-containing protein [Brachyspira hyodysente
MGLIVDIKKKLSNFDLDLQFEVKSGVFSILGASGSGKSMALKCIAGIEKPDSGYIECNGNVFYDSKKRINIKPQKRNVGFLFQNYALFPNMTVEENIKCGIRDKKSNIDIEYIMKKFFINHIKNKMPREISGGEQQRTALARIFVSSPNILMLDEPLSALDYHIKWELEKFISSTIKEFDGTTLFVSHNRDEVYRLSDNIGIINKGKFDIIDSKYNLFENPKTYFSALLTGYKNFSKIKILENKKIECIDWNIILEIKNNNLENIENANYIGMRPYSFFDYDDNKKDNIYIKSKITNITEDMFSYIITLMPHNSENQITWRLDKDKYKNDYELGKEINLSFNTDDIIFLK